MQSCNTWLDTENSGVPTGSKYSPMVQVTQAHLLLPWTVSDITHRRDTSASFSTTLRTTAFPRLGVAGRDQNSSCSPSFQLKVVQSMYAQVLSDVLLNGLAWYVRTNCQSGKASTMLRMAAHDDCQGEAWRRPEDFFIAENESVGPQRWVYLFPKPLVDIPRNLPAYINWWELVWDSKVGLFSYL